MIVQLRQIATAFQIPVSGFGLNFLVMIEE